MMQMGKSMPCLYEEKLAVPAMASAQQSGSGNTGSNNGSNSSNPSQSYEQMLGTSSGAGSMSLVPQNGASGQFQPTPDKIEESQTVDKMAYNSWKGMLARNIGRAVHPGRSAYITADIYSIRFVEFPQGNNVVTLN